MSPPALRTGPLLVAPLLATQIQPRHDAARQLAEAQAGALARALLSAFDGIINGVDRRALSRAIGENHFSALWRQLGLERLGPGLTPLLDRLGRVHAHSQRQAAALIEAVPVSRARLDKARPSRLRTPAVIALGYDPNDPARLVAAIEAAAQAQAEQSLSDGLRAGLSPDQIAADLIDTVGLGAQEARAIETYRRMLETRPAATLNRALRDPAFDAAARGGALQATVIDRMVSRYAARYRAFRAERLAATESLRAANQGRRAAWLLYAERTGRGVRRFWQTAGDELVCPICRAIPGLNPNGVPLDAPYQSPIGPLDAPPDPHPNCRCTERFERDEGGFSPDSDQSGSVGLRIDLDYGQ